MQQFVRTVNTTDAFKMKMEQLEREYQLKLKQLDEEIDRLDAEMDRHAVKGVGGEIGGGFLGFISWIAFILGGLALLICLIGMIGDGAATTVHEYLPLFLGLLLFSTVMFILGGVWRGKGNRMWARAMAKQEAAEKIIAQLEEAIAELREQRKHLEAQFREEMQKQKDIYQQHMLNQQELLKQEVETIHRVSGDIQDTKECPQCAEVIKIKAKICRYCNYQFSL